MPTGLPVQRDDSVQFWRDKVEDNRLRRNDFDPLAYIESAFLDTEGAPVAKEATAPPTGELSVSIPSLSEYLSGGFALTPVADPEEMPAIAREIDEIAEIAEGEAPAILAEAEVEESAEATTEAEAEADGGRRAKFRKTVMSAPRPRRTRQTTSKAEPAIDPELQSVWQTLPKNVAFLCGFYDDSVTKNYYRGEFKESRQELVKRLLDPELSLEETSRLLGVCPATVRRYTNRQWLAHHRTTGGQRRFRLSDIVKFVDEHGRFPEE